MCGIYSVLNYNIHHNYFNDFMKIKHRGPDSSTFKLINDKIILGFHRLAINGLGEYGDQPFHQDGVYLICNGEIYNHKALYEEHNLTQHTQSDCEIILSLYLDKGIEYTCKHLRGEWSFILFDTTKNMLMVARDSLGKRPLYIGKSDDSLGFCSEPISLIDTFDEIQQFPPATYACYKTANSFLEYKWFNYDFMVANEFRYIEDVKKFSSMSRDEILEEIHLRVTKAVRERVEMSDVPVGSYLSGGLDSSLVTAIASQFNKDIHTFTIGLEGSVDIAAAKKVAKHLGIEKNHHVYTVTMSDVIKNVPHVIKHCGSYDITSIRCACYQYLLSKYVREHPAGIKVMLTGEGADEMSPGYFEFNDQFERSDKDFKELSKRRMAELYYFDLLRSDRSAAAWSLEVRMPLLDENVIQVFQNVPVEFRRFGGDVIEKMLLRDAFAKDNLLPEDVLYRRKHAFSDAINGENVVSYRVIEERVRESMKDLYPTLSNLENEFPLNTPTSYESLWYRSIFKTFYSGYDDMVTHFWLPDIPNQVVTDPSATVLSGFKMDKID